MKVLLALHRVENEAGVAELREKGLDRLASMPLKIFLLMIESCFQRLSRFHLGNNTINKLNSTFFP